MTTLPALSAVQDAYTAIDKIWADAEAQNRAPTVAEANAALQLLATAIGITEEPDGKEGEPLISLAHAVCQTLMNTLTAHTPADAPAAEYERLLRSAEQEAVRNPPGADVLVKIADRWLSQPLADARRRSSAKTSTTHFGSPATPLETTGFERVSPAVNDSLNELRALGLTEAGVAHHVHSAAVLVSSGATDEMIDAVARIIAMGQAAPSDLAILTRS